MIKVLLKKPKQTEQITYCDEIEIKKKYITMITYVGACRERHYCCWFYNHRKDIIQISEYKKEN